MSPHRSSGVVTFSETDASGRFHYTNALKWVENTEHDLYRSLDLPIVAFPRRAVAASFERPFFDGEEYVVELEVERLGNSSISYAWRILNGSDVAVTGSHAVIHLDESGKPSPVPDGLRDRLGQLVKEPA